MCLLHKDDEEIEDDDEINETYDDSETYDEEDDRKPAARPGGAEEVEPDEDFDESSVEGDY